MPKLNKHDISKLKKIIALAHKLISESAENPSKPHVRVGKKRVRRSGKELSEFRKMLKAARKSGVSAAELAKKHNVSLAYIYTL